MVRCEIPVPRGISASCLRSQISTPLAVTLETSVFLCLAWVILANSRCNQVKSCSSVAGQAPAQLTELWDRRAHREPPEAAQGWPTGSWQAQALLSHPCENLTEPRKKKRHFLGTDIPVTCTHLARAGTAACSTCCQVYRHLCLCTGSWGCCIASAFLPS